MLPLSKGHEYPKHPEQEAMRQRRWVTLVTLITVSCITCLSAHEAWPRKLNSQPSIRSRVQLRGFRGFTPLLVASGQPESEPKASDQRALTGSATASSSTFNLAKNIIGAGMLPLAAGMAAGSGTGPVAAVLLALLMGATSAFTFQLMGKLVQATGSTTLREAWEKIYGRNKHGWWVDLTIVVFTLGMTAMYSSFITDVKLSLLPLLPVKLPGWAAARPLHIALLNALVLLPLSLSPDLSKLTYVSVFGLAAATYTTLFSVWRSVDGSYAPGGSYFTSAPFGYGSKAVPAWRIGKGTAVLGALLATAFTAHPNAAIFMRGLKEPSQWGKVVHAAFGVAALVYTATMLAGFRTFGMNSQSVLLNNYASADPLAVLARLATVVSLVGAYPLLFKGLLQAFESLVADAKQFPAALRGRNSVYLLFGLSTLVSIGVRDLTLLGGLVGSLAGSAVVYLLPGYLWLGYTRLQQGAAAQEDRAMAWALVALGWVLTLGGSTVTVLQGFTDFLH